MPAISDASAASSTPRSPMSCAAAAIAAPIANAASTGHDCEAVSRTRVPDPLRATSGAGARAVCAAASRSRTRCMAGLGPTVMMGIAARNGVFRTMNGERSEAVGVASEIETDVGVGVGVGVMVGYDEDPRRYVEQTAPGPSRRMIASVCRSSVGPEGRLSFSTLGLDADIV